MNKKIILIASMLLLAYYFYYKNNIDCLLIIIFIIMIVALLQLNSGDEGMTNISNEALTNLASMYNNGTLTATNLNVTGNLAVGGTQNVTGNLTVGGTQNVTGNLTVASNLTVGGTENVTGNLTVGGSENVTGNLTVGDQFFANATNPTQRVTIGGDAETGLVTAQGTMVIQSGGNMSIQAGDNPTNNATSGNVIKLQNFTFGSTSNPAGGGMSPNANYDYIQSTLLSYGMMNQVGNGTMGMNWNDGRFYSTFLENGARINANYGYV